MESLFLRALRNEPLRRPPVWMMRQAGRYLPEYRALKEKHGFMKLCKTPELALEVTLQPLRALDVDAAIMFSDILVPVEGMGIELDFNPGPQIQNPVSSAADIAALRTTDVLPRVKFVFELLKSLKKEVAKFPTAKSVIGFAGAPWTLACYIINQGPIKHFQGTQVFAHQDRKSMHLLLTKLTQVVTDYVLAQRESGADAIQLFDTWGGNLSAEDYREFSLPYLQQIFSALAKVSCPTILYLNGSAHLLQEMTQSGATCISIDWRTDLEHARRTVGDRIVLQGNFDPAHLYLSPAEIRDKTQKMILAKSLERGYIANLGHGIFSTTPVENARAFVNAIREFSRNDL